MGVSGLLPLLKPIQNQRHLSEFSGKTVAVDAYVWLHKGSYGCATELATGKHTSKYVHYAMHRVRMLRHYGIQPYLVFDGGPLPAKRGTEDDRQRKREDNLRKGNELAAKGQHTQAREYYTKCIDVTPQMAYQLIKALKAEAVPYLVAPYEADAQMAYLENLNIVDAILTEDSDLLVFGCRNVLYKLDVASAMVTHICRADFAAVSSCFLGWSDREFRTMAILSGCDYLPSILGVGLKTAQKLLKKHKTVEKVVRAISLEGKKNVPNGYLKHFAMAEKVFLHQRVYDPVFKKLVHLTAVSDDDELDEETQAYVGRDLDSSLAKKVAEGETCPISLQPMEDINPSFTPHKPLVKSHTFSFGTSVGKDSASRSHSSAEGNARAGILHYFAPKANTVSPSSRRAFSQPTPSLRKETVDVGHSSGKRTLGDVMDEDIAHKRLKYEACELRRASSSDLTGSRFFRAKSIARPSALVPLDVKDGQEDEDDDVMEDVQYPVEQEDGYISPSPSVARLATPDLSSPPQRGPTPVASLDEEIDRTAEDGDYVPTPRAVRTLTDKFAYRIPVDASRTVTRSSDTGRVLVCDTPSPQDASDGDRSVGLDLRDLFQDGSSSDIHDSDYFDSGADGPLVENTQLNIGTATEDATVQEADDLSESDNEATEDHPTKEYAVARGWWSKYATTQFDHRPSLNGDSIRSPLKRRSDIFNRTTEGSTDMHQRTSAIVGQKRKSRKENEHFAMHASRLVFEER